MYTLCNNGHMFRIMPDSLPKKDPQRNTAVMVESTIAPGFKRLCWPLRDFAYGYEERNGQPSPTHTIAIVPFLDPKNDDRLFFGIGLAVCSKKDQPNKRVGRIIAEQRARVCIESGCSVFSREHAEEPGVACCGMYLALEQVEAYIIDGPAWVWVAVVWVPLLIVVVTDAWLIRRVRRRRAATK